MNLHEWIYVCKNPCINGDHQFWTPYGGGGKSTSYHVLYSYLPPPLFVSNKWFLIAIGYIYVIQRIPSRTVINLVVTQLSVTVSPQNIQCYWIRSCGLHSQNWHKGAARHNTVNAALNPVHIVATAVDNKNYSTLCMHSQMVIIPMFKYVSLWDCYQKYQNFVANIFLA